MLALMAWGKVEWGGVTPHPPPPLEPVLGRQRQEMILKEFLFWLGAVAQPVLRFKGQPGGGQFVNSVTWKMKPGWCGGSCL